MEQNKDKSPEMVTNPKDDSPSSILPGNPSHHEASVDFALYLPEDDDNTSYSPPMYSNPSHHGPPNDCIPYVYPNSLGVAPGASATTSYGGPGVQGQQDKTHLPVFQPFYSPQQSKTTGYQIPAIYAVVNPNDIDNCSDLNCSIVGAIVLSAISLLFCLKLGIFAVIYAVQGQRYARTGDRANAIKSRNIAYSLATAGIIITGVIVGILIYFSIFADKRVDGRVPYN